MTFVRRITGAATIGVAMLIGSGLSAPPAWAGYIVDLTQVGSDVVATGSGAIDLTGLTSSGTDTLPAFITPNAAVIATGPASFVSADFYRGTFSGPTNFGSGRQTLATSGSGNIVDANTQAAFPDIGVPAGYMSDTALSDTSTYDNQTLATLGVTPGTYEWTWGTGPNQNFTLDATVPAPLIGHGLPALLAVGGLLIGAKLFERSKRLPNPTS
jgi:hypothetical protein